MKKYLWILAALVALAIVPAALAGGNDHGKHGKSKHHHQPKHHPRCESSYGGGHECEPPPPPDACLNLEGYQAAVPVGYTANSDHVCTQVVVNPTTVPVPVPEAPNAVAFCYSYGGAPEMITPAVFKALTTSLILTITVNPDGTETSVYAPAWTTGFMASWNETTSSFTCVKGLTYTGSFWDTSGENVTAGEPTAAANWGKDVVDANGTPQTSEWYPGVK